MTPKERARKIIIECRWAGADGGDPSMEKHSENQLLLQIREAIVQARAETLQEVCRAIEAHTGLTDDEKRIVLSALQERQP